MSSQKAQKRRFIQILALAALVALAPAVGEAKMPSNMGSRGSRTFSAPPATSTAPRTAAPIERSFTPPPAAQQQPGFASPRPSMAPQGSSFGRGLLGGLAGGLLGAGLFGLLTGHGFLGGLEGFASFIGLLFQLALVALLARFAFAWWQSRKAAPAGAGPRAQASFFAGGSGFGPGGFGFGGGAQKPQVSRLQLSPEDFPAFEQLLSQTQDAYSREDSSALRRLATPEMTGYFEQELATNRQKGVVNRLSGVKLLKGDLSEAWREGADEYATVAMRYAFSDVLEDRASGRVVSGDPSRTTESTEIWTFRRPAGAGPSSWILSAIQDAG
jgi:predicted lipid-binding transport protein (Tim44 family)